MLNKKILILDDESTLRTALFRLLDKKGFHVVTAQKIEEARAFSQGDSPFQIAIVDLHLPDGNGIDFIQELQIKNPDCKFIILTGHGTIDLAVKATQLGAIKFLTKPFQIDELTKAIDSVYEVSPNKSHFTINQDGEKRFNFSQIIGQSNQIKDVLSLIEKVADSDSTILIQGESGTGKELIARAIHFNSDRASMPFIAINCGAIPSELLESELFGHVKGAFTGAISQRIGRFEMADGGTIFLDEIGDLEPSLQVKILRALQERCFEPVGSTKTVEVDVRVITATHKNLEKAVEDGKFREDLFYRLNVIPIHVPSLRERPDDISLLLNHFIQQFNKNKNKKLTGVSPDALLNLTHYSWPGNIRELENLVERITILKGHGNIEVNDLPEKYKSPSKLKKNEIDFEMLPQDGLDFNSAVDAYENALILRALEKTGWNRNQAAALLKLNRTTLVEKIKKKGLAPENNESPSF